MKIQNMDKTSLSDLMFLLVFALVLLMAFLVAKFRSETRLTEPIWLDGLGLAVSLPEDTQWERFNDWTFESDNTFVLAAQLRYQQMSVAEVRWKYVVAPEPLDRKMALNKMVHSFTSQNSGAEYTDGSIPFCWTVVYLTEENTELAVGSADLPDGRVLELYVRVASQPTMAQDLFVSLADSVQYQSMAMRRLGSDAFYGLTDLLVDESLDFLVHNKSDKVIGYSKIRMEATNSDTNEMDVYYEDFIGEGSGIMRTNCQLKLLPSLTEFEWAVSYQGKDSKRYIEYLLKKRSDGEIQVRRPMERIDQYWSVSTVVSEILLPQLAQQFLKMDEDTAIVDVISGMGLIVPTILEKMDPQDLPESSRQITAVVKIDYLHDRDSFEEIYFDAQGEIVGKYEQIQRGKVRNWRRATPENILFHFGELFDGPDKSAKLDGVPSENTLAATMMN